jgi:hypothetical protein
MTNPLSALGLNVGFLAVFGVIAAAWGQVKSIFTQITRLFLIKYEFTSFFEQAIPFYLQNEKNGFKRRGAGLRKFCARYLRSISKNKHKMFIFEIFNSEPTIFWQGIKPLIVSRSKPDKSSGESEILSVQFFRYTFNLEKLLKESLSQYEESVHGENCKADRKRFFIRSYMGTFGLLSHKDDADEPIGTKESTEGNGSEILLYDNYADIGYVNTTDCFENLALSKEAEDLIEEIKRWRNSEKWYKERSIPWKLGVLFYGPPGNGKTASVRVLGKTLDLPILCYDLATMTNQDFTRQWRKGVTNSSPAIALIEDIDAVFNGRTNIMPGGLTFDCLLNCLDGVSSNDGILLIITTNNIDKLDPALGIPNGHKEISTRPGRIDKMVFMGNPDQAGRLKMAKRILSGWEELIPKTVEEGANDSGAQFQERCCAIALTNYWQKQINQMEDKNE